MMNYDTYTFEHKSHQNECAPDTKIKFTTHQEEDLDEIIDMMASFLITCGYSKNSVKRAMGEFAEE